MEEVSDVLFSDLLLFLVFFFEQLNLVLDSFLFELVLLLILSTSQKESPSRCLLLFGLILIFFNISCKGAIQGFELIQKLALLEIKVDLISDGIDMLLAFAFALLLFLLCDLHEVTLHIPKESIDSTGRICKNTCKEGIIGGCACGSSSLLSLSLLLLLQFLLGLLSRLFLLNYLLDVQVVKLVLDLSLLLCKLGLVGLPSFSQTLF